MENGFFLITGTSRGIGEALAQKILEKGNMVLGVARGRSDALKSTKYHHLSFDLTDTSRISQIMKKVDEVVDHQRFDFICLVNNASAGRIRKKVAFISSGSAYTALPQESIYCGSKAGMNMFAQCVGLEQKDKEYRFEVICIGPGKVDTAMQQVARSKNREEYVWVDLAKQVYENGELQDPGKVAEKIYTILDNKYDQGQYVEVSEV